MTNSEFRYSWFCRQGLDSNAAKLSISDSLVQFGWQRGVGGSTPYIGLFSRGKHSRTEIDKEIHKLNICELPSARGCTYVLPAQDFALGLAHAKKALRANRRITEKLGMTDTQIENQKLAVCNAVREAELNPADLKKVLGDLVLKFGDEGKKRGMTTSLPTVLGELQAEGKIRRISENGRLDQERYRYTKWFEDGITFSGDPDFALIRTHLNWAGITRIEDVCWFTGLSQTKVKSVLNEDNWVEISPGFFSAQSQIIEVPKKPEISFIGAIDPFFNIRRNLDLIVEPEDLLHPALKGQKLEGSLGLIHQAILDRGRLIGFWEFDSENCEIIVCHWSTDSDQVESKRNELEEYVLKELQVVKTHSLDSTKSQAKRIQNLRQFS